MEYHGNLYGKVGNKYFTSSTTDDFDIKDKEIKELKKELKETKAELKSLWDTLNDPESCGEFLAGM